MHDSCERMHSLKTGSINNTLYGHVLKQISQEMCLKIYPTEKRCFLKILLILKRLYFWDLLYKIMHVFSYATCF